MYVFISAVDFSAEKSEAAVESTLSRCGFYGRVETRRVFTRAILLLLMLAFLPFALALRAEDEIKVTRGGEPNDPGDFCIWISGTGSTGYTGYLHGSAAFTLKQAIEAAGGIDEWTGEIVIHPHIPSSEMSEAPEKRIKISAYLHDAGVRNFALKNRCYVRLQKIHIRPGPK